MSRAIAYSVGLMLHLAFSTDDTGKSVPNCDVTLMPDNVTLPHITQCHLQHSPAICPHLCTHDNHRVALRKYFTEWKHEKSYY